MEEFLTYLGTFPHESLALSLFFAAMLLSTGVFPGNIDIAVLGSGLLIATDKIPFELAFIVVLVGTLLGEFGNSTLAFHLSQKILKFKPIQHLLTPNRLAQLQQSTDKNSFKTCLLIRFSPLYKGTLLFIASAVALARRDYYRFFIPLTCVYVVFYQSLVVYAIQTLEIEVKIITLIIFTFLVASCVAQYFLQRLLTQQVKS